MDNPRALCYTGSAISAFGRCLPGDKKAGRCPASIRRNDVTRKKIIFFGRVQAVGFRYRSRKLADLFGLTGWVENNWDGSVSMEVQGREEDISKMLALLQTDLYIRIRDMDIQTIPVDAQERSFGVRY